MNKQKSFVSLWYINKVSPWEKIRRNLTVLKAFFAQLLLFFVFHNVSAQIEGASILFDHTTYDFEEINETNGIYTHVFSFVNDGTEALKIQDVEASCGCTIAEWTSEEISPRDSGYIKAVFNPLNRPGVFEKTIEVTSNSIPRKQILTISGVVLPRPRTINDIYPYELGGFLINKKYINYELLLSNESVKQELRLYNNSDKKIDILSIKTPSHIRAQFWKEVLEPNESTTVFFVFDAALKNDLGHVKDTVIIRTNDSVAPIKEIEISATIEEYFKDLTNAEKALCPKIHVDKQIKDIGKVEQGQVVNAVYYISNVGKSNLNIRKVKTSCDCLEVNINKTDLDKDEGTVLNVRFNTTDKRGTQFKRIYVFSNDPEVPSTILVLRADVILKKN